VYRDLGHGDRALIIENKDTFCSAVAACATLGEAGAVRWVIFGGGNAILQTYPSMLDWEERPAHVAYFGDIDTDGLEILWQLCAARHMWTHLPPVAPCEPMYARLVERVSAMSLSLSGRPSAPAGVSTGSADEEDRVGGWAGGPRGRRGAGFVVQLGAS
jgi:hypothetical protein